MNTRKLTEINGMAIFTEAEVANYLGVTDRTLRNWRAQGRIKSKRIGRKVIYTAKQISDLVNGKVKKGNN